MSVITCHPLLPSDHTMTADTKTASLDWIIKLDAPATPQEVADLPETPAVGDLYPFNRSLVCQSVNFRANGSGYDWICSASYGPRTLGDYSRAKKPWQNPPQIRNSVEYQTEVCTEEYVDPYETTVIDAAGETATETLETRTLMSRFGELFDPPPTTRIAIDVKQMTWYTRKWSDAWTQLLRDTVNRYQVTLDAKVYAPRTVWLSDLVVNTSYYDEQNTAATCYQVDATFRIKSKGWQFRPMLAGYRARSEVDGPFHAIYEKDGVFYLDGVADVRGMQPVQTPVPLGLDGRLLFGNRVSLRSGFKSIKYESHQLLRPADWMAAAIPTVKAVEKGV